MNYKREVLSLKKEAVVIYTKECIPPFAVYTHNYGNLLGWGNTADDAWADAYSFLTTQQHIVPKPDYKALTSHIFIVYNEKGFKEALRIFWGKAPDEEDVNGYVLSFPALVSLTTQHHGDYHFLDVEAVSLDVVRGALK